MKFDQVDDTVTISNNGPWDFSSIVRGINYEMKVLPLDSSIHASNYPGATHVLKSANGEFFLSYESIGMRPALFDLLDIRLLNNNWNFEDLQYA